MDRRSEGSARGRVEKHWLIGIGSSAALALVIGCGGGGGGSNNNNNQPISGDNAEIAVAVSAAQATAAGTAVPFAIMQQIEPTAGAFLKASPFFSTRGLTFVDALQLYASSATSGKTLTVSYFTDSAGKKAVGSIVVTCNETIGSTYTYPVTFAAKGTISDGSLPMNADFTVKFTDAKGANTLTGTLKLPTKKIDLTMSLTLDDSLKVALTDSLTSVYHTTNPLTNAPLDVTTKLTKLVGGPATNITGQADVSAPVFSSNPLSTGTGSGTLDLLNGGFSLNITSGDMKDLIALATKGQGLSVQLGSGLSKVITDPNNFNLGSLTGNGGGTSSGGTTSGSNGTTAGNVGYAQPVPVTGTGTIRVEKALGDGEMVGYSLDASNKPTALYWSKPSAAPMSLDAPSGFTNAMAHGIANYSNQTLIVGSYQNNGINQPCFWTRPSGQVSFKVQKADSLQYGGDFLAVSANGNTTVGYSYDQSFKQHPLAYISGGYHSLIGDGRSGNLRAIDVDNSNDVLGVGDGGSVVPGVWKAISLNSNNDISTPFTGLVNEGISNPALNAYHMSDTGTIVGGTGQEAIYWKKENGFGPLDLSLGSGNSGGLAYGISQDGTKIAGAVFPSGVTQGDLAYWSYEGNAPVDIAKLLKNTTYVNMAGSFILNDGSFICLSVNASTHAVTYVYVKKT